MKKTLKIGMLAAAAVLMVLTGCKNSFAPTTPSEDSFKAEVTRTNSAYNTFSITGVTHNFYGDSNNEKSQVTITFTHNVTVDGVKNGVRFYKLTDADKSWTMPAKAPLSVAEADIKVDGKNAYFTVGTKGVDHLYVFVEAAKTQAESGAYLNQDGDDEWVEKHDDDVAYYKAIGNSTTLKGDYNVEKKVSSINASGDFVPGNNTTLSALFNPQFKLGSGSSNQLVTTVEVDATTFNNMLTATDDSGNAIFTDAEKDAARSTAAGLLTKHLKAEYYNWKESKWVTVDLSFSYKKIEADASTYTAAFTGWRSDITLAPNRQIRFKWVDTKDMKMELKTYGYPIKYSLNDTNADSRVKVTNDSSTPKSGFLYDFTNRTWPGTVAPVKTVAGKVTLTLGVPTSAPNFGSHAYSATDKTGYEVTVTNPEWTLTDQKKSLFAGFAASADKPKYFKCFESNGQEIAIEKVSLLQSDVATYPEAWDQLVIYFKDSTKKAAKVYISPEVTSAAFKGSYSKDSKLVAIDIPSLPLADVNASGDPNVLGGWLQK